MFKQLSNITFNYFALNTVLSTVFAGLRIFKSTFGDLIFGEINNNCDKIICKRLNGRWFKTVAGLRFKFL